MTKLTYPKTPTDIRSITAFELARMTWNDEPVVAMRIPVVDSEKSVILVVRADGSVASSDYLTKAFRFIDYLGEDESVTIHGSATETAVEQLDKQAQQEDPDAVFPISLGDWRYDDIPNFVPFFTRQSGDPTRFLTMIAPSKNGRERRIFRMRRRKINGEFEQYSTYDDVPKLTGSNGYFATTYIFDGRASLELRECFKSNGSAQSQCDISWWPF